MAFLYDWIGALTCAVTGKPVGRHSARVAARNPMSRPAHRWSSARYGPMFPMMCDLSCTLCMSTHALRKQATIFQDIQENMAGRVYYGHHLTLSAPLQRNREARTSTKASKALVTKGTTYIARVPVWAHVRYK